MLKFTLFILLYLFSLHDSYALSAKIGIIYNTKSKYENMLVSHIAEKLDKYNYKYHRISSSGDSSEIAENLENMTHILVLGDKSVPAAKASGLPGVFFLVKAPQKLGLTDEYGNYTSKLHGVDMYVSPDNIFEFLTIAMPLKKRVGVVYDSKHSSAFIKKAIEVQDTYGIKLIKTSVKSYKKVMAAFNSMKDKIDVMLFLHDPLILHPFNRNNLIKLSIVNKIPAICPSIKMARDGCLASLSFDHEVLTSTIVTLINDVIENKQLPSTLTHCDEISISLNMKTSVITGVELSDELIENSDNLF